jgi:hypothetical protein
MSDAATNPPNEQGQAASPSDDELKQRFREALDRKNAGKAAGESHADNDGGAKAHDAHGPAKSQRTFRRKSGG